MHNRQQNNTEYDKCHKGREYQSVNEKGQQLQEHTAIPWRKALDNDLKSPESFKEGWWQDQIEKSGLAWGKKRYQDTGGQAGAVAEDECH